MFLGAQLYTVREFTQNPSDIAKTFNKLKKIGYNYVQLSGVAQINPKQLKQLLDEYQIQAVASHINFNRLENDLTSVIDEHNILDVKYISMPIMPKEYRTKKGYYDFAKKLSLIGKELVKHDLIISYHNHGFEFERIDKNLTGLDILVQETDPQIINFELDTYWIQFGGADIVSWIKRLNKRIYIIHFKDMGIKNGEQIMTEVGEGNLNWPLIISACKAADIKIYLVEQDICQRNPFESLEISFNNLHSMGIEF